MCKNIRLFLFLAVLTNILFLSSCKKANLPVTNSGGSADGATGNGIDYREIENGNTIYSNSYVDQPYIVKVSSSNWLCSYTYSTQAEGGNFENVGVSRSVDKGKTWTYITSMETPPAVPTAFYGIPFINASGRVYVFYGYNTDDVIWLDGARIRTDAVGNLCYRYSDDGGDTWSQRYKIAMPVTQYDSLNNWQGKEQMWWSICKPITANNQLYFSFTKLEKYLYTGGEGWVVNCPNINTEPDVTKLQWNFLPPGGIGIRSPTMGPAQEEHNIVQLSNGNFYCVFRTEDGYPAYTYSTNGCVTWSVPKRMMFSNGNFIFHPRACARIFKFSNGKYLLWFHNNNSPIAHNRNPAWISGGVESNGTIYWSQPEVLLYSKDSSVGLSYPDIIEDGSNYYVTETQKSIARIHQIDPSLLNGVWQQGVANVLPVINKTSDLLPASSGYNTRLPYMTGTVAKGLTLNLKITATSFQQNSQRVLSILSSDNLADTALQIALTADGKIGITLFESNNPVVILKSDAQTFKLNTTNYISFALDANSRVLTVMVNGVLANGQSPDFAGWARIPQSFNFSMLSNFVTFHQFQGSLNDAQFYNTALTTSYLIADYLSR